MIWQEEQHTHLPAVPQDQQRPGMPPMDYHPAEDGAFAAADVFLFLCDDDQHPSVKKA
jgi:hypothetical protein